MALIERLCQIHEEGEYHLNIALNPFCEALFSVLGGYHSVDDIKSFYDMTAEDITEMDALVARIIAYPNDYRRDRAVHRVRSILTFWEQGDVPGYQTVAQIRAKMNTI